MAFEIKEFLIAVVSVILAAYILNYFGYLNHSSPMKAFSGLNSVRGRNPMTRVNPIPDVQNVNGGVGHTSIPRGSIGATELTSNATAVRPL